MPLRCTGSVTACNIHYSVTYRKPGQNSGNCDLTSSCPSTRTCSTSPHHTRATDLITGLDRRYQESNSQPLFIHNQDGHYTHATPSDKFG